MPTTVEKTALYATINPIHITFIRNIMKKCIALCLLVFSLQTSCLFDFRMDRDAAEALVSGGYTDTVSRALSYSGLACILIPLLARAGAKYAKESKPHFNATPENPYAEDSWQEMSERYIQLGKNLIWSGIGVYAGGSMITYLTLKYELGRLRR